MHSDVLLQKMREKWEEVSAVLLILLEMLLVWARWPVTPSLDELQLIACCFILLTRAQNYRSDKPACHFSGQMNNKMQDVKVVCVWTGGSIDFTLRGDLDFRLEKIYLDVFFLINGSDVVEARRG